MHRHDLLLILTHDDTGHPLLIRCDAGSEPIIVARWPARATRSATMRRRWLREISRAGHEGRDVLGVDATL